MVPQIMDEIAMKRALMRVSHEIIEKNADTDTFCIVGILRRGVSLANIIAENLKALGQNVLTANLDITFYRDDITSHTGEARVNKNNIDFDVNGKTIILVDDVLYTGRTARAAMEAVISMGRPARIQLAVLIDRGHRELPIRADFVGKNVPSARSEKICVNIPPYDETTNVVIVKKEGYDC